MSDVERDATGDGKGEGRQEPLSVELTDAQGLPVTAWQEQSSGRVIRTTRRIEIPMTARLSSKRGEVDPHNLLKPDELAQLRTCPPPGDLDASRLSGSPGDRSSSPEATLPNDAINWQPSLRKRRPGCHHHRGQPCDRLGRLSAALHGSRLRRTRVASPEREIAHALGVSPATIYRWRRDHGITDRWSDLMHRWVGFGCDEVLGVSCERCRQPLP
jgi:hypothetical protein